MKRFGLLLALMLAVCSMNAQKGNKKDEVVTIDKVMYRITYTGKMVPDTTTTPYSYYPESELRLDIGMSTLNGSTDITFTKKDREEVTQKQLRDAKHKFDAAETMKAVARKTGFTFKGGLPAGALKALNRGSKGNPIELE